MSAPNAPASAANVGALLTAAAARNPEHFAISAAHRKGWQRVRFRELDERSSAIAAGLRERGVEPGSLCLVMVRAGIDLITLTYALFKAAAVPVLIDPGMGLRSFLACVARTQPDTLIGIPLAHLVSRVRPGAFASVKRRITLGPRLLWGGSTLSGIEAEGRAAGLDPPTPVTEDDLAAVLFTSGSTGPAKGAVYTHGNFAAQVRMLGESFGFGPGEVDLAAFPLFSLFDAAFGMTSVIPRLDPSRPGSCDPAHIVAAIHQHDATLAFGSPAIWRRVAPWCRKRGVTLPSLRQVLIAGAPVPPELIDELRPLLGPDGEVVTPYGATEALPVASIRGREVIEETAALTREGEGTCVGRPVPGNDVRLIAIDDGPIADWSGARAVPAGDVGEICVRGPVVTRRYHNLDEATAFAKIADADAIWHRMGDLGRFDEQGRLWFCGRKAERVETASGPLFTDRIEGRFLAHRRVGRCALVGVGPRGAERPVLVVEGRDDPSLAAELLQLGGVDDVLFHPRFPVDVRHNAKIHRLQLKAWAEARQAAR